MKKTSDENMTTILSEVTRTDEYSGSALPLWSVVTPTRIYLVRAADAVAARGVLTLRESVDVAVSRIAEVELSGEPTTHTVTTSDGRRVRVTIPND